MSSPRGFHAFHDSPFCSVQYGPIHGQGLARNLSPVNYRCRMGNLILSFMVALSNKQCRDVSEAVVRRSHCRERAVVICQARKYRGSMTLSRSCSAPATPPLSAWDRAFGLFLVLMLTSTKVFAESPAPSVHWGSVAFPDQYSTLTTGLTVDRFTPTDGGGAKYDSTVPNTLGFNLLTFSWTQHGQEHFEGWSINLTGGISPSANQPSEFFQNKVVHQLRHLPPVPTFQPRQDTDAMIDGSVTKWFFKNKTAFLGGGFSVGTIYQEQFLRTGIRRLHVTPDVYRGNWGAVSVRTSVLGRVSLQEDGAVLHATKPMSRLVQPALAIGQYRKNENDEEVPTWEVEVALTWDSGIFVNGVGQSRKQFFWSAAFTGGPMRFETWNDSMGNISKSDFGPTYGASLTVDLFRLIN